MYQDLSQFNAPKDYMGRPAWLAQLWWIVQGSLFLWSPQFMYGWRRFLLRLFGARIGKNVIIRPTVKIQFPWKLSIGDNSWIGDEAYLYNLSEIKIGANTVISQRSYLCAGSHDYTKKDFPFILKPINVDDEVWVAANVFIAPGVSIGKGAVVGARSSIFKDLEGGYVYVGNPAKKIKKREASK